MANLTQFCLFCFVYSLLIEQPVTTQYSAEDVEASSYT